MRVKAWFIELSTFSKWRILTGLILAMILSACSLFVIKHAIVGYVSHSVVGSGLVVEFIDLFGKRKVDNFLSSPWPFIFRQLCFSLFTMFYFLLFYQREKRRVFFRELDQLIIDTKKYVSSSDIRVMPVYQDKYLLRLTECINRIINKMDTLIKEERSAQKTKNDLITNISHDLRTPLTSIMGYLELITKDRYKDEVELRYYVDIAYEKSTKLHSLIQDLFEFTRVQNHQLVVKRVPLNIKEMLGQLTLSDTD